MLKMSVNELMNNFRDEVNELEQKKLGSDLLLFRGKATMHILLRRAVASAMEKTSIDDVKE